MAALLGASGPMPCAASRHKICKPRCLVLVGASSSGNTPLQLHHQPSVAPGPPAQPSRAMAASAASLEASNSTTVSSPASKCPMSQLTSAVNAFTGAVGVGARPPVSIPIPGPAGFSLEALKDVSVIFLQGLHVAQLKFSEKYGPVCRFANPASLNGATSWVFLNSPDNIAHVAAGNVRNYGRRYLPDIYTYVTHGKGILGSQDDYNARHRKLCSGPFRNRVSLQRFSSVVVERSLELVDIWQAAAAVAESQPSSSASSPSSSPPPSFFPSLSLAATPAALATAGGGGFVTDVATQTQRLTLDIVGLVAFSHDFKQVEQVRRDLRGAAGDGSVLQDRVLWAVNTFGEVLAQIFITPLPLLKLLDRLGLPHLRQLNEAVSVMRAAMLDVIHERRAALAAGRPGGDDLLQSLLTAVDDGGRGLTDEELWEDVHDIMGAGHETTATTAAALLYCVSAHPHVRARVEAELDAVLPGGEAPSYEALERMPYLQACAKEVMRLYPAIPVFPREALRDDVLPSGHPISAGDVVFMSSYALGRSAAVWEDPLTFNPDRFSPEAEARQHRFQWLPFGAGPRMCLGASFAQMSVCLMAATLLQRFRFTPLQPASPLIPVGYDITMNFQPSGGLRMRVEAR